MKTFKYPVLENFMKCECCGGRAMVLAVYGEHEEPLCAECYVKTSLEPVTIEQTDGEYDLSGAVVGNAYYISDCKFSDIQPYEYGFRKHLSFLKVVAESIMCVGEQEVKGKRTKSLKVILKPEYKGLYSSRYFENREFYPAQLERTHSIVKMMMKELGQ